MSEQMTILYSCPLCGIKDAEATVRFRESSEDVIAWMKQVVEPGLARAHSSASPTCFPESLVDVKIPIPPGTEFVGGPVQQ